MFIKLLRFACTLCILSTFWAVVRVADFSVFELMAVLVIPAAILCAPDDEGVPLGAFKLAGAGLAVLTLAGIISSQSSFDSTDHLLKVFKLVTAYGLMLALAYVITNRKILSVFEILNLLAISAAVCSFVAILQGQFGLLRQLIPAENGVEAWTRMTGLAEHPIEAGVVSGYGFLLSIGLATLTRRFRFFILLAVIDAYALRYTASLTAFFALIAAAVLFCIYTAEYRLMSLGAAVGAVAVAAVLTLSPAGNGLLSNRLATLYSSQGNYQTVQSRQAQLNKAVEMIEPSTLFVGNGYSSTDLPFKMEIHNGLVASIFHFGLLGLTAQGLLIAFFVSKLRTNAPRHMKGILIGCIVVFAMTYLSGPAQARPTLWAPMLLLGAALAAPMWAAVSASAAAPAFTLRPTMRGE